MKKKLIIGITAEGSVNLLSGQLAYFKSLGYDTYLLAPYSERSAAFCEREGCVHLIIKIEREISPIKDLKSLWEIYKIFKRIDPDIVNLGTPKVSLLGMVAAFLIGVPKRIYTCRGFRFEHENGIKRWVLISMEKITSFFAHKVICISKSVETLGLRNKIFSKNKSEVIFKGSSNGVNLTLFNPENEKLKSAHQQLKQKYQLQSKFIFGFLGRMVDRKGINELFEVFCELYSNHSNIALLLVGPFELSQIQDKTLVDKINRHPGIINYGKVSQEDVPGIMLTLDVFVLPAWWEGFGNVLVQAAAMGIPVISTYGTGTIDAVSENFNGILVPVKDKIALKEAMVTLMDDDKLRMNYGKNGKVWAQHFDRKLIWDEMHKIYQN
ncbi:MAG: glycosyltransferase family 4 protein [Bacteroidia bacterium]|nr:glycosyltransferase family 4 protein [Bacteroidia bacterium]MCF8445928.1 glycosyltransferase family 4 protein [Bacteroidia bacterium]